MKRLVTAAFAVLAVRPLSLPTTGVPSQAPLRLPGPSLGIGRNRELPHPKLPHLPSLRASPGGARTKAPKAPEVAPSLEWLVESGRDKPLPRILDKAFDGRASERFTLPEEDLEREVGLE